MLHIYVCTCFHVRMCVFSCLRMHSAANCMQIEILQALLPDVLAYDLTANTSTHKRSLTWLACVCMCGCVFVKTVFALP